MPVPTSTHRARRAAFWTAALLCGLVVSFARADWPRWLGPTRDAHVPSGDFVPDHLADQPKQVWKIPTRGGFSSAVVSGGTLVYLDEDGTDEVAHRIDAGTGIEKWKVSYSPIFFDEWGPGPRSTPILDGDVVFVQSCRGDFRCLSLQDGHAIWGKSFVADFGAVFAGMSVQEGAALRRGNNGGGIVDGGEIIVPVGSTKGACLVCLDKKTGSVLWKSQDDEVAYSSLQVATLAGVKQVVAFTAEHLLGVRRDTGALLWRVPLVTAAKRHAATPVIFGDEVVVNSHTFGLVCTKITRDGDKLEASRAWTNKELKINLATPVFMDGYLYTHGAAANFVCVEAATGAVKWSQRGFGKDVSFALAAGKNLLVLADTGELFLLAANPGAYTELGRAQVCGKTWSSPAYVDGRLFVRDGRSLACFDLKP
jgi:outer membrane protein assembly factor BamB